MMKNLFASVVLSALLFVSCAPMSKDSYLEQYELFIEDVAELSNDYTEEDWAETNEKYEQYSQEWYQKFEKELTAREKMTLAGFALKYNYYYARSKASAVKDSVQDMLLDMDVDKIQSTIQEYIENDLSKDVQQLYEEAVKLSGDATEVLDGICKGVQSGIESAVSESEEAEAED